MEAAAAAPKRRRDSFSRAWSKVWFAVRRSPAVQTSPVVEESTPHSATRGLPPVSTQTPESAVQSGNVTGIITPSHPSDPSNDNAPPADATASTLPLIVDTSAPIEVGDPDDQPTPFNGPMDYIKSTRARLMFEKYGIQYEEGPQKSANGRSHIQRSIRIRLHWQCHNCRTGFGGNTTCRACGHVRCTECPRSPTKRVRELLGDTMAMKEIEAQAASASTHDDVVCLPVAIGAEAYGERSSNISSPSKPLGADSLNAENQTALDMMQLQYTNRRQAALGPQLHPRPRGDRVRRTCHECGAIFTPHHTHKCMHCGHDRCTSCPYVSEQSDATAQLGSSISDPPLRRVYRKPRQRVRWSCDRCHATFLSSKSCLTCGHERCERCIRSPVHKTSRAEPDPAVLAALEERLSSPPAVSAAA